MKDNLAMSVFTPENEVKAAMFIVHGMEEHRKRYAGFAGWLAEQGIGVITYDLPGHGETDSKEDRGWFGEKNGWDRLVESAVTVAAETRRTFPGVPLICFSHSMGTMICRTFLQKYDTMVDAVILSGAPAFTPAASAGKAVAAAIALAKGKRGHSKLLDQMATGNFNNAVSDPRTPVDWLSMNEENVDRYIADPDCGFPFTIQGYADLFDGMVRMHDVKKFRCLHPDLPILLFAGEYDPCIGGEKGFADSAETLRKAGYKNVETKLYPDMRHETLQEKDAEVVYKDVYEWIKARFIPEKA